VKLAVRTARNKEDVEGLNANLKTATCLARSSGKGEPMGGTQQLGSLLYVQKITPLAWGRIPKKYGVP
jgi:methylglyoxal synthase